MSEPRMTYPRMINVTLFACLGLVLLSGCESDGLDFDWFKSDRDPEEPTPELIEPPSDVVKGSVGELAFISNANPLQVKGFGLVVGLNGNGSRDVASTIRRYLIDQLKKDIAGQRVKGLNPNTSVTRLLESPDTAVVELTGTITTGMAKSAVFDVTVSAATGTQTSSLEGGLLLLSELKRVGTRAGASGILLGETIAVARGPVFTSPFADEEGEQGTVLSDPRRGLVLGGGRVLKERPITLVLNNPSYDRARRIGQRINERFGHSPKAAEPMSQSQIHLHPPEPYQYRTFEFAQLAAHVYLNNTPAFFDLKMRELIDLVETGTLNDVEVADVARAWEAIGEVALSRLVALYEHRDPIIRFFAVRTGLRLGEINAIAHLGKIAGNPKHPMRLQAVQELGRSPSRPPAVLELRPMLNTRDSEVRIAAYRALRELKDRVIRTRSFNHRLDRDYVNFEFDVAPSSKDPLLYAHRVRHRRLAMLGGDVPVQLPVFFESEMNDLLIVGRAGEAKLTVLGRVLPEGPREKFEIRPTVVELVEVLAERPGRRGSSDGLGMTYSQVLRVLYGLSTDGSIPARLVFETPSVRELGGPTLRREADEPTLEEFEAELREEDSSPSEPEPDPDSSWDSFMRDEG
jgi:hypothetical protein